MVLQMNSQWYNVFYTGPEFNPQHSGGKQGALLEWEARKPARSPLEMETSPLKATVRKRHAAFS